MSRDVAAARALLAYYNRPLIQRLVRHVLNESKPEARKALTAAVIDLVLRALKETTYASVNKFVEAATTRYIQSAAFAAKVEQLIAINVDNWTRQILEDAMREKARQYVASHGKSYNAAEFLKTVPGRFQLLVEQEVQKQAEAAVRAHVNKS